MSGTKNIKKMIENIKTIEALGIYGNAMSPQFRNTIMRNFFKNKSDTIKELAINGFYKEYNRKPITIPRFPMITTYKNREQLRKVIPARPGRKSTKPKPKPEKENALLERLRQQAMMARGQYYNACPIQPASMKKPRKAKKSKSKSMSKSKSTSKSGSKSSSKSNSMSKSKSGSTISSRSAGMSGGSLYK